MFVSLFRARPALWWGVLLPVSASLAWVVTVLQLPAGVLLGCMFGGIVLSSNNIQLKVPPVLFSLAQGVLGCLMAHSLQPAALAKVAGDWPLFLLVTSSVIAASAVLGWLMMRRQIFPGTTAIWGLAPGAASAMVLMAEAYGADVRLVAFMQYLRVAMVTVVAALVAGIWSPHVATAVVGQTSWLAITSPGHVSWTVLLALGGALVARRLRIPAGSMVLPLVLAYAFIGWSIGLRFTRAILLYALRALPQVLGAIVALVLVGVVIAVLLSQLAGLDPLTAYLATSPGGADSVAVIAATSAVDTGFVMAMQLARFLMVLVFGPQVSQFVARRTVSGA